MSDLVAKLTIKSLDMPDAAHTVEAQYNPKELQVDQNVPWKKPEAATQAGTQKQNASEEDPMALEFVGAEGRTMSVELLFDGYENPKASTVARDVGVLVELAAVIDPKSTDEKKRRPHQCMVTWGTTLPKFKCVIESLSTKYTMFSKEGDPLRATCTVKLKEANAVEKKKK
ncbi:MAG TPA: hypothetical protein VFQ53_20100 [Kofleriaceae bacterium]|nr:hypothetical protein [Kofleriaceae bacterium]